ncbi:hypothetical protein M472_01495 [Sphingobacterium paucimobilis HER1398]|uniref:Uncharacterized protein n=1 Tax=Sphingobacterium paucimobilis HER1398 TaxID=1346330 RepID=U2H6U5_9SPHI|nr:hypothetical protein M472_01495 [Sphingobacterium paucimobilis HER1398]
MGKDKFMIGMKIWETVKWRIYVVDGLKQKCLVFVVVLEWIVQVHDPVIKYFVIISTILVDLMYICISNSQNMIGQPFLRMC